MDIDWVIVASCAAAFAYCLPLLKPIGCGLKQLKKILDKEGLLKTLRDTRYFEKPCVKARKKSARARIRNRSRRRMQEM